MTASVGPSGGAPLSGFPIPAPVRAVLEASGIRSLYPPQASALKPLFEGRNLVLACPTASGKSLVAYLALLRAALSGGTGLYLVPLRALAQEKFEELERFSGLGLRIGLSIGDFDLSSEALEKIDILVATSEKADGLLRRGAPWLQRLGCVVADEVHLLRDPDRGPTLEVSLSRLRVDRPKLQIVALSATVGNSAVLADWLGAVHVASDFRPVPLRSGVFHQGEITFTDLGTRRIAGPGEPVARLVRSVIEEGGQALVFVNTRKASDQVAESLVPVVRPLLSVAERTAARAASEELGAAGEEETEGIRRLGALLPSGVAYHNASLTYGERRVIERAFRGRTVKAHVATPTLAAGINLPARRVIVRDLTRYDDRVGMQTPIPTLEVQQMCGRAGRPGLDPSGEAVLLARSDEQVETYLDEYLSAPPEDVRSQLGSEPALRTHLLALVASGAVSNERELERFFEATFYGHTRPVVELDATVRTVRSFLEAHGFLEREERLRATPFGALTSELYLDPLSAVVLRQAVEKAPIGVGEFALLSAVAATPDLPPLFLRRGEERELLDRFVEEEPELLVKPEEEPLRIDLDGFLSTLKTASVLEAWVRETPIVELTDRFGIGAGDLKAKVEDAEWLLFGALRIAQRFQRRSARALDALSLRVRYGVREELLDLVRLRGIGRVRGRALHAAGLTDREAVRAASPGALERVLRSPALVESVRVQVGAAPPIGRRREARTTPSRPTPSAPAVTPARSAPRSRRLEDYPAEP